MSLPGSLLTNYFRQTIFAIFFLCLLHVQLTHSLRIFNNQVLPSRAPNSPSIVWKPFKAYSKLNYLLGKSTKRHLKNSFWWEQIRCSLRKKKILKLLFTLNKAWFMNLWHLDERKQEFTHLLFKKNKTIKSMCRCKIKVQDTNAMVASWGLFRSHWPWWNSQVKYCRTTLYGGMIFLCTFYRINTHCLI